MMQFQHLSLAYGSRILCQDVSFSVNEGECLLLAGPNGSGKSTLLRLLAGEVGAVSEICGHPRPHKREGPAAEGGGRGRSEAEAISDTAPTSPATVLIPTGIPKVKGFTLEEFVRTGCYRESDWAGRLNALVQKRLNESLSLLGLEGLRGRDISTLSDGEFQKACIAVALTRNARLLLLDEPTAFLDVDGRAMVLRTLREVAETTGIGIIFSSHDLSSALLNAHRVLALTPDGRFLESTPENRTETLAAAFPLWHPVGTTL